MSNDDFLKIINQINVLSYQGRDSKAKRAISRICHNTIDKIVLLEGKN